MTSARRATRRRVTNETSIDLDVNLDGSGSCSVSAPTSGTPSTRTD